MGNVDEGLAAAINDLDEERAKVAALECFQSTQDAEKATLEDEVRSLQGSLHEKEEVCARLRLQRDHLLTRIDQLEAACAEATRSASAAALERDRERDRVLAVLEKELETGIMISTVGSEEVGAF